MRINGKKGACGTAGGGRSRRSIVEPLEGRVLLSGTTAAYGTTVVHWWGDYIRGTDEGMRWFRGQVFPVQLTDVDVDGDGDTSDDIVQVYPFSMVGPLNPPGPDSGYDNWGYYTDRPSARFYGGLVARQGNYRPLVEAGGRQIPAGLPQVTVEGEEGANPHMPPDDRYPHSIPRGIFEDLPPDKYSDIAVFCFHPTAGWNVDASMTFRAVFMWKKEDFLNDADRAVRVVLDERSLLSVDVTRYWHQLVGRWVVQDGASFYVSEATIDRVDGNGNDLPFGKTNELVPTQTRWARYTPPAAADPRSPAYMGFDRAAAVWETRTFGDVRAVGLYLEKDWPELSGTVAFCFDNFRVDATVWTADPNLVRFAEPVVAVMEGQAYAQVAVVREPGPGTVTVQYATGNATARANSDFVPVSGTLTFKPGELRKVIKVPIIQDAVKERTERFTLMLRSPAGGAVLDDTFGTSAASVTIADTPYSIVATASVSPSDGRVKVFHAPSGRLRATIAPYGAKFNGAVRVAVGDVNGDGVADIVTAPGAGAPVVKVYDGRKPERLLRQIAAFNTTYRNGLQIALADFNRDGAADIAVYGDDGAQTRIRIFRGNTGKVLREFPGFASLGGAALPITCGDVTGDAVPDIIAGTPPGYQARIRVFNGLTGEYIRKGYPFGESFTGGLAVAVADLDEDGFAEYVAAPMSGGGTFVVLDGLTGFVKGTHRPYGAKHANGMYLAFADVTTRYLPDLIVGTGAGKSASLLVLDGATRRVLMSFAPYPKTSKTGFLVGGSL